MAPMAVTETQILKRTSSEAQFDNPTSKKLHRSVVKRHKARWDVQTEYRKDAVLQGHRVAGTLLKRSISLALEAVGFQDTETVALASFQTHVEEYISHYLATVRQSMLASRRIQCIPQDFLRALQTHQLSLRALLPHLDPPVPASQSQLPLEFEVLEDDDSYRKYQSMNALHTGEQDQRPAWVPRHFPALPDKHTYQSTPQFAVRETDPRRIREKAAEEGRLAEEALRKLVIAGTAKSVVPVSSKGAKLSMHAQRDQLWRETMLQATAQGASDGNNAEDGPGTRDHDTMAVSIPYMTKKDDVIKSNLRLGDVSAPVNSERKFWRQSR